MHYVLYTFASLVFVISMHNIMYKTAFFQLPVAYETESTTSCVYMKTIPPVTRETRVKWKHSHNFYLPVNHSTDHQGGCMQGMVQ